MHTDILTADQQALLPLLHQFSGSYYLAGGTAIALYIRHRRSIDFDLFTKVKIQRIRIRNIVNKAGFTIQNVLYEAFDQMHCMINGVKMTFFNYPFEIEHSQSINNIIPMPGLLDLAAMKAFALGGRGKWKDYVDLYFLIKNHFSIQEIEKRTRKIFQSSFNEKLFREQLSYFEDIDFSEEIDFIDDPILKKTIQKYLTEQALSPFS